MPAPDFVHVLTFVWPVAGIALILMGAGALLNGALALSTGPLRARRVRVPRTVVLGRMIAAAVVGIVGVVLVIFTVQPALDQARSLLSI